MKAFEFTAELNAERTITIPPEVFERLGLPAGSVRVILLVDDDEEDERDWRRLGSEQFAKGYEEDDALEN